MNGHSEGYALLHTDGRDMLHVKTFLFCNCAEQFYLLYEHRAEPQYLQQLSAFPEQLFLSLNRVIICLCPLSLCFCVVG